MDIGYTLAGLYCFTIRWFTNRRPMDAHGILPRRGPSVRRAYFNHQSLFSPDISMQTALPPAVIFAQGLRPCESRGANPFLFSTARQAGLLHQNATSHSRFAIIYGDRLPSPCMCLRPRQLHRTFDTDLPQHDARIPSGRCTA